MKYHTSALLIMAVLFFATLLPTPAHGFGISPARTEVLDILAGSIIQKKITVSRRQIETEEMFNVVIAGSAAPAIMGDQTVVLPRGISEQPYYFLIDTTKLKTNGPYDANITFSPAQGPSTAPTTILTSIKAAVRFTITPNKNKEFYIKQAKISESKEQEALAFSYFMINSGNIETRPEKIILDITDVTSQQQIEYEIIPSEKLPIITPFSEQMVTIPTAITLPAGQYMVTASLYSDDTTIVRKEQFPLQVILSNGHPAPIINTSYRATILIVLSIFFVSSVGVLLWALAKR